MHNPYAISPMRREEINRESYLKRMEKRANLKLLLGKSQ